MKILKRLIRFLIKEKTDKDDPSFLIALYPSAETVSDIIGYRDELKLLYDFSGMRELEPEELHATVRWWDPRDGGQDSDLMSDRLGKIPLDSVSATIRSIEPLGDSLSLMLDSNEMQNAFSMIDQTVRSLGAPPSSFPAYKPHIALFYHESFREGFDPRIGKAPDFSIVFDRLELVDGDDNVYYSARLDDYKKWLKN